MARIGKNRAAARRHSRSTQHPPPRPAKKARKSSSGSIHCRRSKRSLAKKFDGRPINDQNL